MIFAVIPAAGHSTRMGRPKLSLQLGERTVLEHVVTALRCGGVEHVVVVVGPHVPELIPLAMSARGDVCVLSQPTPDMRSTVELGLRWLEDQYHPRIEDHWILAPADHPTVNPKVIRSLISATTRGPGSIIVPVHANRRGHPTLFAWKHAAAIRGLPISEGINTYVRQQALEALEVSVDDPGVLVDLDTPEDLERLRTALTTAEQVRRCSGNE